MRVAYPKWMTDNEITWSSSRVHFRSRSPTKINVVSTNLSLSLSLHLVNQSAKLLHFT
jgi:hypothetical protein